VREPTCIVDGCDRAAQTRDYCGAHYSRVKRYGHPQADRSINPGPLERMRRRTLGTAPDECWIWQGSLVGNGYGNIRADGRLQYVHRVAYQELLGPIPDGLELDHVRARGCISRACWNPAHLEPVTRQENQRRTARAMQTECLRGHEFTQANTYEALAKLPRRRSGA
jgi:5-methylcytosine-specific restriction endonuclease McrA